MNKLLKSALSLAMALALMFSLGTAAFADEWYIGDGNITVNASVDGEGNQTQCVSQADGKQNVSDSAPVIKGGTESNPNATSSNTVTINATAGAEANVTLNGVNIDTSKGDSAAITVKGEGAVNIELDGDNTVKSASDHAGIEKQSSGELTISDNNKAENGKDATLTATGGNDGAGIGGGDDGDGDNITITGGTVNANGGYGAAGIGGGFGGDGNNITITGGTVNATGGEYGAGIGGGSCNAGDTITIKGGNVTANGGGGAAGIGGGEYGDGTNISITGGSVTANGGSIIRDISYDSTSLKVIVGGAGIGGGEADGYGDYVYGNGYNITISDAEVNATGGYGAAGIGGGARNSTNGTSKSGSCGDVKISGDANVTATGGKSVTIGTGENARTFAAGTAIGNGSTTTTGTAVEPDTSGLYDTGKVVLKNADGTLNETIENKPETPAGDSSSTGGSSATDSSSATSATLISMDTTSPESSPLPVRYYVVTGAEQTWLADSEAGLEFTLNSDGIVKVLIDGEEVEFEINDNGDIVISTEVLQALKSGAHEIEFVFPDGSCKANFTVK